MEVQQIKEELINRIRTDIAKSEKWVKVKPDDFGDAIGKRVVGIQDFTKHIVDTMNSILNEHEIDFDDNVEKDIFVEQMKPTVSMLLKEYLES